MPVHLCVVRACFRAPKAQVKLPAEALLLADPPTLTICPFKKKVSNPWFRELIARMFSGAFSSFLCHWVTCWPSMICQSLFWGNHLFKEHILNFCDKYRIIQEICEKNTASCPQRAHGIPRGHHHRHWVQAEGGWVTQCRAGALGGP